MNVTYVLEDVAFEWDQKKAQENIEKHGVAFEEAAEAFFDPFYQGGDATVDGEQHRFIIGYSLSQRLLLVVYMERGERIRIISARPATRAERKCYEEKCARNEAAFPPASNGGRVARRSERHPRCVEEDRRKP